MEDSHGIFHNIDSLITMVFLEPFEKQVWPAISLPCFCLASPSFLIHEKISPLRFVHLELCYSGDPGEGDAPVEDGAGEGQGQDGGQE